MESTNIVIIEGIAINLDWVMSIDPVEIQGDFNVWAKFKIKFVNSKSRYIHSGIIEIPYITDRENIKTQEQYDEAIAKREIEVQQAKEKLLAQTNRLRDQVLYYMSKYRTSIRHFKIDLEWEPE